MLPKPYVVLVGMDFSEFADRALVEAFDLSSRREKTEIHVVYIASVPPVDANYALAGNVPVNGVNPLDGALEQLRAHVQTRLDAFLADAGKAARKVSRTVVSHVRLDSPSLGIAQFASELNADLIIVGTHGRAGLARMLMGSVAEMTVRYARCPVLVIPSAEPLPEVKIEPACAECLRARAESGGRDLWCEQHRERHGRRHTYHQADHGGEETNFPLVLK
jgi:nucleotide-binding universal stress UspA family protein